MKEKRILALNRFLSNKKIICCIIILIDCVFCLLFNYVMNIFSQLQCILNDTQNAGQYFGWHNLLLNTELLQYSGYRALYIIFCIVLIIIDFMLAFQIRSSYAEDIVNVNQKGDQRWTTLDEIKQQYRCIDEINTPYEGPPGIIISQYQNKIFIDDSISNNYILGMTRSGKDQLYVFKCIEAYSRAKLQPSIINFDPKLESYKSTKSLLENRGYGVYLLNIFDPIHSMGWNPLTVVIEAWKRHDYADAQLMARTFAFSIFCPNESTGDSRFFDDNATNCMVALIIAMTEDCLNEDNIVNENRWKAYQNKRQRYDNLDDAAKEQARKTYEEKKYDFNDPRLTAIPDDVLFYETHENERKINIYSIIYVFRLLQSQPIPDTYLTALDLYFQNRDPMDMALMSFSAIEAAGGVRTKGSIYSNMLSKLIIFTMEANAKMTAESSFNLEDIGFGQKPIAVFISMPDYDPSNNYIATSFIRQMYYVLSKRCGETGKCNRWVKVIANEIGQCPEIQALDSMVTVGLGKRISFDFYFQSDSQCEKIYQKTSKIIKENCGNHIYLLTADSDTAKAFSENLGNKSRINVDRTGSMFGFNKTFMERIDEEPLIRPSRLMELEEGETVIKRTMKRRDLNGNSIRPRPIFNTGETRLKFAYEYMYDFLDNPDEVNLSEINKESREHIILKDIIWDPEITFMRFKGEKQQDVMKINDLPDKRRDMLLSAVQNIYGQDFSAQAGEMSEGALAAHVSQDNCLDDINKQALLMILEGRENEK